MPATTTKIHCLCEACAPAASPTYRPTKAVSADSKLSIKAFLIFIPVDISTAKSPAASRAKVQSLSAAWPYEATTLLYQYKQINIHESLR